jgi:Domain of unknown function (DUF4124)
MRLVQNTGLLLILLSLLPAQAARNKWVDEKGQTHYGDRVPAQYLSKQRQVLNDQGIVVRKHNRLKTDEERTEEQKKRAIQLEKDKRDLISNRKKALRDRVLTDTFTTERDILMARDRRIDAITSQINLTETIIKDDEKKLAAIKKRIENIEKSNRTVPENTKKSLVSVSRQLETHYQYVETKNHERESILLDFDKDIKRFRELKAARKSSDIR